MPSRQCRRDERAPLMELDYPLIDFHAHVRGELTSTLSDPAGGLYSREIADLVEPLTRQVANLCGMHFRDPLSRFLARSINHYATHELARVFDKYTIDWLLDSMARNGIGHAVICPMEPFCDPDEVARAIAPYPDRFSFFVSVDPSKPEAIAQLETRLRQHRVAGLKVNPARAKNMDDKARLWACLSLAQEKDLPVFLHMGALPFEPQPSTDVDALAALVSAFKHLSLTLAHIGWDRYPAILALAEKHYHLSVETSWQPPRVIREAVDKLGAHRVLLGSDFPLLQQSISIENAQMALNPSEFKVVAHKNAHRLLGVKV
jgi:predicted TIM-barrel fold metal-dependent hydrolase